MYMPIDFISKKPEDMQQPWDVTPAQARAIQEQLRTKTLLHDDFDAVKTVAGVDVGLHKATNTGRAAITVLRLADLEVMETAVAQLPLTFPYVPGLLSFREIPVIFDAFSKLTARPDLLLCDGQGIAHPRRFGIACHLGILLDIPAIGVAKTRLIGHHAAVPETRGEWTELRDGDEVIGAVLRTRERVKPLFISPGHRISLTSSIEYVMQCITKYRLPETTRTAHKLSLFAGNEK